MADNIILPDFPGMDIAYKRTPLYTTDVQNTKSGREVAISYETYPRYEWELKFNALRDYLTVQEARQLETIFHALKGRGDYFLFADPERNYADGIIGVGTGTNANFRLTYGHIDPANSLAVAEPVNNPYNYGVYVTGWSGAELRYQSPRTNLALQSQAFDNGSHGKSAATVGTNTAVAPDGTTTADSLIESNTNSAHYTNQSFASVTIGTPCMVSVYVKETAGAKRYANLLFSGVAFASIPCATFDAATGTITYTRDCSAWVQSVGNGWYRISMVANAQATGAYGYQLRLNTTSGNYGNYAGDGVSAFYVWGLQVENAPAALNGVPSAYITTAASTVTVAADYAATSAGLITFSYNIPAGYTVSWKGYFRYRVRMLEDKLPMSRNVSQLWNTSIKFRSIKV